MAEKRFADIEAFVLVDGDGDFVVHKDRDELQATYNEDIGSSTPAFRVIKVQLRVELPEDTVLKGTALGQTAEAEMTVE